VPRIRLGLSGPKVVETARGAAELNAGNAADVEAVYGVAQRVAHGFVEGIGDDARAVAHWLAQIGAAISFGTPSPRARPRWVCDVASGGPSALPGDWTAEWIAAGCGVTPTRGSSRRSRRKRRTPRAFCGLDAALLEHVGTAEGPRRLLILEIHRATRCRAPPRRSSSRATWPTMRGCWACCARAAYASPAR
jgi:hypothetical protein